MNDLLNIFILAAGLGERLQPITHHIPKPLLPVLGKPVLQYVLDNVSTLSFNKIGINIYHKKEIIEEWVSQCTLKEKIILFPEEIILDTGGALKNAESFLKQGTFLVHNSDILSDINLRRLIEHHLSSKNLVTLAVHDYPEFNNLIVDKKGFLKCVKKKENFDKKEVSKQRLAFTGIAVYEPEFLNFLPAGTSSVVDAWLEAISTGYKIGTFNVNGCYWRDIGTPSAYASAVFDALRKEGEVIYIHPSVSNCQDVDFEGYVVVEKGCVLDKDVLLKNCILLEGSILSSYSPINCIIGPGFRIELNESEILNFDEDGRQLIGTGGSDRRYYRVRKDNKSVVLMQCSNDDPDFKRQIEYARFFIKHSIPVPELIGIKYENMQALFEDAGDISLYSYLRCPRSETEIENIYRVVIDAMVLIHTIALQDIQECPLLRDRIFNYEYFRWETDYFIKRFVRDIRNIEIENSSSLEREFHQLAFKADSFPKTVIHRDLQSQNIMIVRAQEIRIIDYQGARIGPPAYDVASILWDPYYHLEDNIRERLIDYYINQMENRIGERFNKDYFRDTLLTCRLQRHMQALGAYGYLSLIKKKKYFLKYIPEGLRLLKEDISLAGDEYPVLYRLIMEL
jgi:NDP-sugar pyrophosphorylase family protein